VALESGTPLRSPRETDGFITGLASVSHKVDQLNVGEEVTRSIEILRGFYSSNNDLKRYLH
jgi:hypothetical protein